MARAGLTQGHICDVAIEMADEVGLDHVTMSAVARRLGVAVPSLYEHVRGIADLLDLLAARATDELAMQLGKALEGRAGSTALKAYAGALRVWALAHPGRYAATTRPVTDPQLTSGAARIAASCAALLRGYGLEGDEATDAVRFLRSTIHGFTSIEGSGDFLDGRALDASWHASLDAVDRALTTWPRR